MRNVWKWLRSLFGRRRKPPAGDSVTPERDDRNMRSVDNWLRKTQAFPSSDPQR